MTKCISAVVRNGRIEADAPPGWPDGTEVRIDVVCRAVLTANDSALTGAEFAVIEDLRAQEERAQGESPTTR
jgi:hypothetical protein